MPWELCLVRHSGTPPESLGDSEASEALGSIDDVVGRLKAIIPGLDVSQELSGPEKIRRAGLAGFEFPPIISEHLRSRPATWKALYEGNRFSLEFHFGEGPMVRSLHIDVRGSGDPWPILRPLVKVENWALYDLSSGKLLREDAASSKLWKRFKQFVQLGKGVAYKNHLAASLRKQSSDRQNPQ